MCLSCAGHRGRVVCARMPQYHSAVDVGDQDMLALAPRSDERSGRAVRRACAARGLYWSTTCCRERGAVCLWIEDARAAWLLTKKCVRGAKRTQGRDLLKVPGITSWQDISCELWLKTGCY